MTSNCRNSPKPSTKTTQVVPNAKLVLLCPIHERIFVYIELSVELILVVWGHLAEDEVVDQGFGQFLLPTVVDDVGEGPN